MEELFDAALRDVDAWHDAEVARLVALVEALRALGRPLRSPEKPAQ